MKKFQQILAILLEESPEEDVLSWASSIATAASARHMTVMRCLKPILPEHPAPENVTLEPEKEINELSKELSSVFLTKGPSWNNVIESTCSDTHHLSSNSPWIARYARRTLPWW